MPKDIFKHPEELKNEDISNDGEYVGTLYYKNSHVSEPDWVERFFASSFNNNINNKSNNTDSEFKIFTANPNAILLTIVDDRAFALTFGYGYAALKPGVYEERFGLKTILSIINPDSLRSLSRRNLSISPKLSQEQLPKKGAVSDFELDIEQDLIQSITAKTEAIYEHFGQTVKGQDALGLSVKINISTIKEFLKKCYVRYSSNDYKKNFGWIDQIFETKDPQRLKALNNKLIEQLKSSDKNSDLDKIWMAVPEIIDWGRVSKFKFKDRSFGDDLDLRKYLGFLDDDKAKDNLSLDTLGLRIQYEDAVTGQIVSPWKIYNCLYAEVEIENQVHILNNGKWYQIENNFVKKISKSFNELKNQSAVIDLPEHKQEELEKDYNERAAEEHKNICNMDRKMIYHGGAHQKVEFCDLFTKDKKLIHVKRYGGSSTLSHLFNQGLVSGELFLSDEEFRRKVNEKLPVDYQLSNTTKQPKASEYKIVYAIISHLDQDTLNKNFDIPFFSKITIGHITKILERYGYAVSLLTISTAAKSS